MDRLNKKCIVASTGMHLLIGLVAFVGPAFTSTTVKPSPDLPVIDFVPDILTDSEVVGGGNPRARPLPAPQPPPVPQPQPQPQQAPRPVEQAKTREPEPEPQRHTDPDSFETTERKQPRKPQISIKLETRKNPKPTVDTKAQQARDKEYADARRRIGEAIVGASRDIRDVVAPATAIEEGNYGPGGGGPTYASYRAWVQSVFDRAWIAPDETTAEAAEALVRVVIASDGTVLKSEFVTRSGDSQMDSSVQRALDRVPTVGRPFPAGAKEKERVYRIRFNLKVKRGLA